MNGLVFFDVLLAVVGAWLVKALILRKTRSSVLPPGPKGLPVIGNVFDMPKSHDWITFTEWNERYGERNP